MQLGGNVPIVSDQPSDPQPSFKKPPAAPVTGDQVTESNHTTERIAINGNVSQTTVYPNDSEKWDLLGFFANTKTATFTSKHWALIYPS